MSTPDTEIHGRTPLRHLREWRMWRGLTLDELAAKSDISKNTISRIENGHTQAYGKTIRFLARGLGITPEQLAYELPPRHSRA